MKNYKSIQTSLLAIRLPIYALVMLPLVFASCSKDDENTKNNKLDPKTAIIGSWKLTSFSTTSNVKKMIAYKDFVNAAIKQGSVTELVYKKDKTGTSTSSKKVRPFKWKIEVIKKDNVIVQTYTKENNKEERGRITSLTEKNLVIESKATFFKDDTKLYQYKLHFEKK